jgi:hypothetical protein
MFFVNVFVNQELRKDNQSKHGSNNEPLPQIEIRKIIGIISKSYRLNGAVLVIMGGVFLIQE